jgi:hypothetical protein
MLLAEHHQSAIPLLSFITRIAKLKNLSSTFISFTQRTVPTYLSFTFTLYLQNITKCVVPQLLYTQRKRLSTPMFF